MTREQIFAKLQTVFDQLFTDPVKVTPALAATEVDEWDSLMHVSLILAVEKAFQVKFSLGDLTSLKNVGEFADMIQKYVPDK